MSLMCELRLRFTAKAELPMGFFLPYVNKILLPLFPVVYGNGTRGCSPRGLLLLPARRASSSAPELPSKAEISCSLKRDKRH